MKNLCGYNIDRIMKLLLVTVLIIISIYFSDPKVSVDHPLKEEERTKFTLMTFSATMEKIKEDFGYYPNTSDGFKVIYGNLDGDMKWNGPYLLRKAEIVDAWGQQIIYRSPSVCSVGDYELYSIGRNGIDECLKGDDISIK